MAPWLLAALLFQTSPGDDQVWLRGAFAGATPEQRAALDRHEAGMTACRKTATARVRAELAAMGEAAEALPERSYGAEPCSTDELLIPGEKQLGDWAAWRAADEQASLLFAVFDYGVSSRREQTTPLPKETGDDARALIAATGREQAYRRALSWEMEGPKLDPLVLEALTRRLWRAVSAEDHKNTAMLKAMVARIGWPSIQLVGEDASGAAWLLVQHADDDPAFQLKALRLMAPMVATGGVSKRNYAYLYDRVMLKIAGKQRYGTQTRCLGDKRVPVGALEAPGTVDASRAEAGLDKLADYLAFMDKQYGACHAG